MNSKQRVLTSVAHREPDRIPITFDAEKEVSDALYERLGCPSREALFDRLHVDTWMILPGNFIYTPEEDAKIEKTTLWGYKTRVTTTASGSVYNEVYYNPLAGKDSISELKAHPWPGPDALDFSHFTREAREHADRAIIGVFTFGAYFISSFVRGLENLSMDFMLRPDYVDHLFGTIREISARALHKMLDEHGDGIDIVFMCDDYCSQQGPMFNPEIFRRFIMPYLRELVAIVHKHDKKFLLHCCGAVRPLLPMIIEAGVDMLEPIQIRAQGMDPQGLKREFGRDLCFYGGVDLQQILCQGTPAQVADEVKRLIDILGPDGGYVLGPGHTYIQLDAPFENIMAMYETAYAYGQKR